MDDGGPTASILIFSGLLLAEAYFYGFGAALNGFNEKEAQRRAEEGDKKSRLLTSVAGRPSIYINTVQMIVTFLNLCMGGLYLTSFGRWMNNLLHALAKHAGELPVWTEVVIAAASMVLTVLVLLYILLVFGIMIPRRIASRHPDRWAYRLVRPVTAAIALLRPITGLFHATSKFLLRMVGIKPDEGNLDVTEEEIISMVNEGHEQGVIQASEAEMITNIFEFGDKRAEDIMINRNHIVAIDCETPFGMAVSFMLNGRNSRYPVYEGNIDHIIGILHMKDALRRQALIDPNSKINQIPGLLREARFIPETRKVDSLFKTMQSTKCQIVIVLDEYGQTAGMISMEDILEEIVGSIMDEYDADESYIHEKGTDEYIIEGKTPLEELEERFHISFGECEFETLNGYLIALLEHIPEPDEQFETQIGRYSFKVLSVANKMIKTVLVTRLPDEQTSEEASEEEKSASSDRN